MKDTYFKPETITPTAQKMLHDLGKLRKERAFDLACAALLVLDMQDYFLDSASHAYIPSGGSIIPGIRKLVAVFEEASRPIIFTRHINTTDDAGAMAHWWRDMITEENIFSQITESLDTSKCETLPWPTVGRNLLVWL